jgi:poly(hydroxyalkanoate) depolymerase family esterase
VIETLRAASALAPGLQGPTRSWTHPVTGEVAGPAMPEGARFVARSFACVHGARDFMLYIPASVAQQPRGLILMLHGCTQTPDDFAAGTNMNAVAEAQGLLVAYPAQTRANNASSCWNWFETAHQFREAGEPAILAGLTRQLVEEFGIASDQVFVAGLSAGAAMAVVMATTYPDVFHAAGVHSGLPYQCAGNVMTALAAMRGNDGATKGRSQASQRNAHPLRAIVFHGSADRTVHPSNAQRILDEAARNDSQAHQTTLAGAANGRRYTQTMMTSGNGEVLVESWLVEGAGHAWSGGKATGSYTDARGPDASAEMVRFFLRRTALTATV